MIEQPLTLPCGAVLPNRLCKAAMTEGLATPLGAATPAHERLYRQWGDRGAGLLITGNIMIDARYLERAGNVVVEDGAALAPLAAWAKAVHDGGAALWAQISHPGRQCPRLVNARPLAPSAVPLRTIGYFARPRAATPGEIADIVARFARAAALVTQAGFDGVQIHAAHGYLLSQFLSPRTNRREDEWGGSLANRARLLLQVVAAVRAAVGPGCPVSVKLNSADFVKGGFTLEDCLQVVAWLGGAGVDLIEISGGTYERLAFLASSPGDMPSESTRRREATFLQYAAAIKSATRTPLMITGGFRTRAAMDEALAAGEVDMIGVARPLCVDPYSARRLLTGECTELLRTADAATLGRGFLGPNSASRIVRSFNGQAQAAWCYRQIELFGAGLPPEPRFTAGAALRAHFRNDFCRVMARRAARKAAGPLAGAAPPAETASRAES